MSVHSVMQKMRHRDNAPDPVRRHAELTKLLDQPRTSLKVPLEQDEQDFIIGEGLAECLGLHLNLLHNWSGTCSWQVRLEIFSGKPVLEVKMAMTLAKKQGTVYTTRPEPIQQPLATSHTALAVANEFEQDDDDYLTCSKMMYQLDPVTYVGPVQFSPMEPWAVTHSRADDQIAQMLGKMILGAPPPMRLGMCWFQVIQHYQGPWWPRYPGDKSW